MLTVLARRTNLNEKINSLRDALPTVTKFSLDTRTGEDESDEDVEKSGQQKFGKAAVLTRALEYIKHLERNTQKLGAEVDMLKSRVGAFEELAMSGTSAVNESNIPDLSTPARGLTLESIQEGRNQLTGVIQSACSLTSVEFKQTKTKPRSRSRSSESALPCKRTKRHIKVC